MAGLLLLDVDGPLNPYNAKPHARPDGYHTFRYTQDGRWFSGDNARRVKGMRVWLNPAHGAMLRGLANETGLELAWATTWQHEANTHIAPAVGLPALPVVEFPVADLDAGGWTRLGGWKFPSVQAYAAGRPLAWLDDEHAMFPTARAAFAAARQGIPTLLQHIDPRLGIRQADLDTVREWADTMDRRAGT